MVESIRGIIIFLSCFIFYIPSLWYHYICDDLGIYAETEKNEIPKPKSKWKYIKMMFLGQAYWSDDILRKKEEAAKKVGAKERKKHLKEKLLLEKNIYARAMPIIIHFIASALIYFTFGRTEISYLAALMFALHPVNTEVSVWLSGKPYGVTAIAVMIGWSLPILAPLLYLFSPSWIMYYSGMFSPVMYLYRLDWWSLMAVLAMALVYARSKYIFNPERNVKLAGYKYNDQILKISPYKIIIALKFYGYFLANSIFGMHFSFFQSYMDDFVDTKEGIKKSHKVDKFFFYGCAGAIALILGFIFRRHDLWVFGLAWATINVAMWCNFVNTGQQYISNRYYYLPNIGICLMLADIIIRYFPLGIILIGWYARQLIYSIRSFEHVYWHFEYGLFDEPNFYYTWLNRGNLNFQNGHFTAATADYIEALRLKPGSFKVLFNLSSVWLARGNMTQAVGWFEQARTADAYAQEKAKEDLISKRMELINKIIAAKMHIKLKVSDIPIVS